MVHYPVFGGQHNEALRLREPLAERGWNTVVVLPDEPGNGAERLRAAGVEVVVMPLHRLAAGPDPTRQVRLLRHFGRDVGGLRGLIRHRGIDLVVAAGLVNPHGAVAGRLEHVPVVWKILDTRVPAPLRMAAMPVVRALADSLMFTGHALVEGHGGDRTRGPRAVVYYPPVDTERFRPAPELRAATRGRWCVPRDATLVGTVANFAPQKGIEYFVRAAALIYRVRPDSHFVVVGSRFETHARYVQRVETELARSGIPPERFRFEGYREDVEAIYPALDVKLVTSIGRSEGATTAALEALACGVPVVATDVGALREVVDPGVTGAVVPSEDAAALAAAALHVLGEPGMGVAARASAVERFGTERCADTHIEAFGAAAAARR